MLRHIFAFSTLALTLAAGAGQPIKVVLVGDSTVNDEGGWGPGFRASFGPAVQVVNLARIGTDALATYAEAVRRLAVERQVPLIDLYTLTRAQTEQLGPAGSLALGRNDAQGKPDRTHLGPKGQTEIGRMAAREFARVAPQARASLHELVSWRDAMRQPAAWFGGDEAVRIAENLLLYQREIGGWVKNIDMALALGPTDRAAIEKQKADPEAHSTIDNDATYTQMRYLARVFTA
jgi:hypothetical protein